MHMHVCDGEMPMREEYSRQRIKRMLGEKIRVESLQDIISRYKSIETMKEIKPRGPEKDKQTPL